MSGLYILRPANYIFYQPFNSVSIRFKSRCTMDRLCLRSYLIQGFLRFDLLRFTCILVFVQCIQTRFTVEGLNFISSAILLLLSPLFLARMKYLIFLFVGFTALFFIHCHIDGYIESKVSGLHNTAKEPKIIKNR